MTAPFIPRPDVPAPTPWVVFDSIDYSYIGPAVEVDRVTDAGWTHPDSAMGSGSLTAHLGSALSAMVDGSPLVWNPGDPGEQVIRVKLLDVDASTPEAPVYRTVFGFLGDKATLTLVDQGERAGESVAVSGRSVLAQWASTVVWPKDATLVDGRWWNFAHSSIDVHSAPWTDATYRSTQGDTTSTVMTGKQGLPWHAANPLAFWIAPRAAGGSDPTGTWYAAFDYTLAADATVVFEATAQHAFSLWVDEAPLGDVWDEQGGDASTDVWRARIPLAAGDHQIRVAVGHFDRNVIVGGLLYVAATEVTDDGGDGTYDEDWLFTSADGWDFAPNAPGRWRTLDYGEDAPGPAVGYVITDLFDEAIARGDLPNWTLGFTSTLDSAGNPWPTVPWFKVEIGEDYYSVLERLRDDGWIEFDVSWSGDLPVLEAWNPEGSGVDLSATVELKRGSNPARDGTLTGLEVQWDHASQASGLLVRVGGGYYHLGGGPKQRYLAIGDDLYDTTEALRKGQVQLDKFRVGRRSVAAGIHWSDPATGPYFGWGLRDWVSVEDRVGDLVPLRVVGLAARLDNDTGRPVYVPQLDTLRDTADLRLARLASRSERGSLGGRDASAIPVSPRQSPLTRVEQITVEWSIPGEVAADLESGFAPPPALMRMNRMLVTATAATAGSTLVSIIDGPLTLYGTATLGAGDTEVFASFLASVLRPNVRYQLITDSTVGDHENIVVIGYGAAMGMRPKEPKVPT